MQHQNYESGIGLAGRVTGWAAFAVGIVYGFVTLSGFHSLQSPEDPMMELLTIIIAPLMTITMVAVHYYASPNDRIYSLSSVLFMFIVTGITTCVHFVILTVGRSMIAGPETELSQMFLFKWPSIVYSLDILAWDWFFPLSILMAATVFRVGRLEKILRITMTVCGCTSLAGLAGVLLDNMQVRNIGILGYGVIAPFVFLLIGIVVGRSRRND